MQIYALNKDTKWDDPPLSMLKLSKKIMRLNQSEWAENL